MLLELLDGEYSVYKFNVKQPIDKNILGKDFVSVTRTKDEISIVSVSGTMENYEKFESGWKILKIAGVLDFGLIGIISKISTILSNESIGIFVMSTYNTDYIMIKKENTERAIKALMENKYEVKNEM
jgi:hypothetical protein